MKIRSTITESFFIFLSLLIIVLISMGMQREERRCSIEYFTWELQGMLNLDQTQTSKIQEINYQYYDALTRLETTTTYNTNLDQLLEIRNDRVREVLTEEQRRTWKLMSE